MFQDTLLIIKSDFLCRRKALLVYLLQRGFQIQGQRKIFFSPELAAEFYQDMIDDPCFMFKVILLSKGPAEAFILTKENAVEDLIHALVCFFGTSMEMDRNVHATRCLGKVRRDITFIFPNYIFEPITCPPKSKFCPNNPFVTSVVHKIFDISMYSEIDPHKSWEVKLAEWLIESNKNEPNVSNQCVINPSVNLREIAQQTKETAFTEPRDVLFPFGGSKSSSMVVSSGTTLDLTSSSCVTCSDFSSGKPCMAQTHDDNFKYVVKAKTAALNVVKSSSCMKAAKKEELEIIGDHQRVDAELQKCGDIDSGKHELKKIDKEICTGDEATTEKTKC